MTAVSRRNFLKTLGGASALAATPAFIKASSDSARVVVIGGGFGGATAAKYLKHWAPDLDVTLVEVNTRYSSPILSNLVVNGKMSLSQISFDYSKLQQEYAVNVVHDWVLGIDHAGKKVELSNQPALEYDRLIVAPGVSFLPVSGHDFSKVPHAWKSGEQLVQLQQQLEAMPAGEDFIISIPPAPYRCLPAPYERACVVADYLKAHKPGSRVIVLDANADIVAEKETFSHAFERSYAGIIEYRNDVALFAVESDRRIVFTSEGDFTAGVLNVIPVQAAGSILRFSRLANDASGHWVMVDPVSYESVSHPGIHIIGDSQATGQAKIGDIANVEAKVCADAVIRMLGVDQSMVHAAGTGPVSMHTVCRATGAFRHDTVTASMKPLSVSAGTVQAAGGENQNQHDVLRRAQNLFGDTFA